MDLAIGIIGIVTGIVSLIIGGLAIWLSIFFYNQSKNSEANVKISLAEIKIQTETMHKVSARLIDRFTRYVTDSPPTEQVRTIIMALKEFQLPSNMSTDIRQPDSFNIDLVTSYIWLYNYCGITNIIGQYALPREEESESPTHKQLKGFVDRSHEDFLLLNNILQQVNPTLIHNCSSAQHLLREAEEIRELVKSTEEYYAELQKFEK